MLKIYVLLHHIIINIHALQKEIRRRIFEVWGSGI